MKRPQLSDGANDGGIGFSDFCVVRHGDTHNRTTATAPQMIMTQLKKVMGTNRPRASVSWAALASHVPNAVRALIAMIVSLPGRAARQGHPGGRSDA
jgi:hypothetical protein